MRGGSAVDEPCIGQRGEVLDQAREAVGGREVGLSDHVGHEPDHRRHVHAAERRVGARLAEPGEFTLRAFLNGRIDLVQAEAVRDLIEAVTPLQARAAFDQLEGTLTAEIRELDAALFDLCARLEASLDFPDEGYHFVEEHSAASEIEGVTARVDRLLESARRGRLLREGFQVVLSGRPNTGKSSIFNSLAGKGRAIVTAVPGTTRDLLTEVVDIGGVPVTVVDTAGVRVSPSDAIEAEGISRAAAARSVAALIVVVLDGSMPLAEDDRVLLEQTAGAPRVIVANKSDVPASWIALDIDERVVRVSALQGEGIDDLRSAIVAAIAGEESNTRDLPAVTNLRPVDLLTRALLIAVGGLAQEFLHRLVRKHAAAEQRLQNRVMQRLHRTVLFVVERMTPRVVEPAREQQVGQLRDEIVDVDLVEQVAGVFRVAVFHRPCN